MTDISDARLSNLVSLGMGLSGRAFGKTAAQEAVETAARESGLTVQRVSAGSARLPSALAPPAGGGRRCRVCDCTETNACVDPETGEPCGWAPDMGDLCTACVVPLETCTGLTPECPHLYCPDGYHSGEDLPCSCTPDCAADEDD